MSPKVIILAVIFAAHLLAIYWIARFVIVDLLHDRAQRKACRAALAANEELIQEAVADNARFRNIVFTAGTVIK